jgi:phosphate starvation-inducible membrane PsiE
MKYAIKTALRVDYFLCLCALLMKETGWNLGLIFYLSGGVAGLYLFAGLVVIFSFYLFSNLVVTVYNNPEKYSEVKLKNLGLWQ